MSQDNKIFWVNIFSFLVSLHYAILLYSLSTILSSFFGEQNIWFVYSLGAISTIILNFSITKFLRKMNLAKVTRKAVILGFFNLMILYFTHSYFGNFLSFILFLTLSEFLFLLSSIMLEDVTRNDVTGRSRGKYISIQSLGYLCAPFLASFVVKFFGINSLFLFSALFLFISLFVLQTVGNILPKIPLEKQNITGSIKKIWRNKDLRNIIIAYIGLYTFYSSMIIYIPFKLVTLGISLTQYLGLLLPIALTPFIFVPQILGYIEDKMQNEKEFLIFGLIGLIIILIVIAFSQSSSLLIWGVILFISRIFASITETSINSYFFKKVDRGQTDTIAIFTSSYNIVYLAITPLFALLVKYTDLATLYLSVSFFLCFVLVLVSKIHDTKNYDKHQNWRKIWEKSKKRV